jgi:hypothetical protein
MKIIYETGDIVEIKDDMKAPFDLGAEKVEIVGVERESVNVVRYTLYGGKKKDSEVYSIHKEWIHGIASGW